MVVVVVVVVSSSGVYLNPSGCGSEARQVPSEHALHVAGRRHAVAEAGGLVGGGGGREGGEEEEGEEEGEGEGGRVIR